MRRQTYPPRPAARPKPSAQPCPRNPFVHAATAHPRREITALPVAHDQIRPSPARPQTDKPHLGQTVDPPERTGQRIVALALARHTRANTVASRDVWASSRPGSEPFMADPISKDRAAFFLRRDQFHLAKASNHCRAALCNSDVIRRTVARRFSRSATEVRTFRFASP